MSEPPPTRASGRGRSRDRASGEGQGEGGRESGGGGSGRRRHREREGRMPDRIGRYDVECELGRGGMGVVYRARDTRLDRLVALKALPAHVAADGEARERFDREARLLASLEHPHVAAIHGIEDDEEGSFLVLQHVEGETLASRLRHGALPVEEALEIAAQVASGVGAAHRRGIIHCDLKPANVMVTNEGIVKLLDFGIATRWRDPATLTTGGGAYDGLSDVFGTPAYMSPEQIAGAPLDPRTDAWSFACTIFECLAGRPPFEAEHPRIVLAMVDKAEPDWRLLGGAPAGVRDLLVRCLAKNRNERTSDMEQIRAEITAALAKLRGPKAESAGPALPRPLSSFVGREREMAELDALLQTSRLVTLTGAAGCGKSRLALQAATVRSEASGHGAWLAALAPLSDGSHVAATVAAAVGAQKGSGTAEDAMVTALRERHGLLILDNCEHLLPECARIAERILGACPGIAILATSREALGIPGETAWRVPSLAHPPPDAAGAADLARWDAVRLFVARAREVRPGFELDDESAAAVAAIIARLDGIPLAIELAAARTKVLAPAQILERLSDRFRLLTGGSRNALERHQTLRAALEWSYGLLTDDEKRCLRELGVFAGGFQLEETVKVCTGGEFEIIDLVTSLVSKSLVQVETEARSAPRYSLLESVRQHAGSKLEDAGEAHAARDRHRDAYLGVAQEIGRDSSDLMSPGVLRRFAAERDNLRAALEWSLSDPSGSQQAARIAVALVNVWDFTGQWMEGGAWLDRVVGACDEAADPCLFAATLGGAGRMAWWLGDLDRATALLARALALHREHGDAAAIPGALMQVALPMHTRGDLRGARLTYEECLQAARALGDSRVECDACANLAILTRDLGELDAAEAHGRVALRISEGRRDERRRARALRMLGIIARDRGDYAQAETLARAALDVNEARGNLRDATETRMDVGHVLALKGEHEAARAEYARCLQTKRAWGEPGGQAVALANVAEMDVKLGRLDDALASFLQALKLARSAQNEPYMASIVAEIASLRARTGAAEAAAMQACAGAARERFGRRLVGAELAEWEARRQALRAELGDEAFDTAWAEGARRPLPDQVERLLSS